MTVEEQLRRTLTDERRALPAWSDPVNRVNAGIRRRRRHRTITTAALTVTAAMALAVPATTLRWDDGLGPTGETAADGTTPWAYTPAPQPTYLARRGPRPDAPDCTLAELGIQRAAPPPLAWVEPGGKGDGYERHTVLLSNRSDSRCTLRGSVHLLATDAATRGRHKLMTWPDPPTTDGVNQYPATIDPGEPARIDLVTATHCAPDVQRASRYRDVTLVALGQEFPITALELNTVCPLGVGSWYVLPPLLNAPFQVASIRAPKQVRRGGTLEYVVTLLNSSDRPFPLRPCPVYTQRLGDEATTYRLNCTVSAIPPHTSVRFAIRLPVSEAMPLGQTTLTWMAVMDDGRVAIADLATGGVPIEVTG